MNTAEIAREGRRRLSARDPRPCGRGAGEALDLTAAHAVSLALVLSNAGSRCLPLLSALLATAVRVLNAVLLQLGFGLRVFVVSLGAFIALPFYMLPIALPSYCIILLFTALPS